MLKKLLRRIPVYSLLVMSCLILNGCPIPMTNKLMLDNTHNKLLPYATNKEKALVYLVQPYTDVDLFLVGGAASDGWGDQQSKIYVRSENNKFQYLGTLNRYHPMCFYARPGQYELKIDNGRFTKPEMMYEKIKLQANQLYFYGIEEHTYVFTTKFSFNKLSVEQGKHYLYAGGRFNKGIQQCKEI